LRVSLVVNNIPGVANVVVSCHASYQVSD
jgi:hypothetical protein